MHYELYNCRTRQVQDVKNPDKQLKAWFCFKIVKLLCTEGTGSFLGVKRPGRGVDHPPPSSADVKERVEL